MAQKHNEKIEAMQVEAEAVAKFLFGLDLKVHKTQLVVEIPNGAGKKRAINCNWVSGTNLHFAVLANKEKILKMVPTMEGHKSFNGLGSIADSQNLIMALISFQKMNRVIPNRMQYTDPKDPAARKPKSVEILPMEHMAVTPTGMYIFQITQS